MFNKDDQDWLDILAGKEVPGADPNTVVEAEQLRAALIARSLEEDPGPQPSQTEIDAFIDRARREGLVAPPQKIKPGSRRRRLSGGLSGLALAASIILAIFLVPPWIGQPPDGSIPPDLVPKSHVIPQTMAVTDPRQFVSRLQNSLTGLATNWQVTPMEDGLRVRAKLSENSKDALAEHGLDFPYEGNLELIITTAAPSHTHSSEKTQASP
uniref:Uncharacterized protein n=1 Tax=Candidatus Kentrum sp. DK TaxID=2126562 RepID=A0A450T294_9GAMM|nr:MAG: hypothetical protein BECKDK2373C_GA0170839_108310 [Candidatus Kentron sp. DK]